MDDAPNTLVDVLRKEDFGDDPLDNEIEACDDEIHAPCIFRAQVCHPILHRRRGLLPAVLNEFSPIQFVKSILFNDGKLLGEGLGVIGEDEREMGRAWRALSLGCFLLPDVHSRWGSRSMDLSCFSGRRETRCGKSLIKSCSIKRRWFDLSVWRRVWLPQWVYKHTPIRIVICVVKETHYARTVETALPLGNETIYEFARIITKLLSIV
jgi:hypothetical protein